VILQQTVYAVGKQATKVRNIGYITKIANKLIHLAHNQSHIVEHLQPEDVPECGFGYELTE
jgi:serine/threonine-protein phosphatase 6 regulatory subunit 3